jgi:hypothetical protein
MAKKTAANPKAAKQQHENTTPVIGQQHTSIAAAILELMAMTPPATAAAAVRVLPQNINSTNHNNNKNNNKNNKTPKLLLLQLQPLVPGTVYTSTHFFSHDECQAWINWVESDPTQLVYLQHPASRSMAQRECSRWQQHNWDIADAIFDRMKQSTLLLQLEAQLHVPSQQRHQQRPIAANGNIRVYKYEKGMSFGKHVDGNEQTERGKTQVTVLVYLSHCVGGATRFHFGRREHAASDVVEGKILFHVHGDGCLEHEGDAVQEGVKYVLRTDLVYA